MHEPTPGSAGSSHDVVIVGGGPVGLALACLLAQRRIDVVVLERRRERSQRPRAIGVHAPGWRVLDEVGVVAELEPHAIRITGGEVSCAGFVLGRMRFPAASEVRSVPQHLVEEVLERRLELLRPGALRRGVAVVGVRHGDEGVRVVLDAGDDARRGGPAALAGGYLVVAEGVRSRAREELGIAWRPAAGAARYAMVDLAGESDGLAHLHFEADGVVESLPMPGGRRWVAHLGTRPAIETSGIGTPAIEMDASAFRAIVEHRVGVIIDDPVPEPSVFTAHQHLAARFDAGRTALAGDTAHEVSPIGGQGMTLGFLDATLLAEVLSAALAAAPDERPNAPFARYSRVRRRAARRACRRARFNMAMGAPARGIRLALRNLAVRTLALPLVRGILARTFTMRGL